MAGYSKTINIGKTGYLYLHLYRNASEPVYRFTSRTYRNERSYFWKPEVKEFVLQVGVWVLKIQWKRLMV